MNGNAVLVGICFSPKDRNKVEISLDELERLLDTAGGIAVGKIIQNKDKADPRTLIGSGKVRELSDFCVANGVELVVFDMELSPSQIANLEDAMPAGTHVIDRSMLILDIFALHATTSEGKIQVELAQLKYTAPRLVGRGKELSRLGGGIGTRGPGESQLETDKRHMQRRIESLQKRLDEIEKNQNTQRKAKSRSGLTRFAIVGYTNAGKSTLLNYLTDAGILAQDQLFCTLTPTTRKLKLSDRTVLLTDTVGLIQNLPHQLVASFRSTLAEATEADAVIILVDGSDTECISQLKTVENVLAEIGAKQEEKLIVYSKSDLSHGGVGFHISCKTGEGIQQLLSEMEAMDERIQKHRYERNE